MDRAQAEDGQTIINQTKALAGDVTPGDAPGFPITLTREGSYRLSSNLSVPANTEGIVVAANYVTIDLNGFRISGAGSGNGISDGNTPRKMTAIRNGSISNFNSGIRMQNSIASYVDAIRVRNNTAFGIPWVQAQQLLDASQLKTSAV